MRRERLRVGWCLGVEQTAPSETERAGETDVRLQTAARLFGLHTARKHWPAIATSTN
jgi:hypothetical protein